LKRNNGCGRIDSFIPEIRSSEKWEVIRELTSSLVEAGFVSDPETALSDLFYRERSMSTGITKGLAIPHARTGSVSTRRTALGLSRNGIDFDSIDGALSRVFFLILTPSTGNWPDLDCLALLSGAYSDPKWRESLLSCSSMDEVVKVMERLN
jgi:PTS system fructose-specific IIC component